MTDIQPLGEYILLKRYVKPEKKSVIIVNDDNKPRNLGVAQKDTFGNIKLLKDDLVQYKPYIAIEVEGHPDYILVKEEDIIAILPIPE